MFRVVWGRQALETLDSVFDYIARDDVHAADRVRARLKAAGDSLSMLPRRGRMVEGLDQVRELVHPRYPYIIRYIIIDQLGVVLIESVWHGAQDRSLE